MNTAYFELKTDIVIFSDKTKLVLVMLEKKLMSTPILGVGGLRLRFGARFYRQIMLALISLTNILRYYYGR